jgi:hypothetical protein
MKTDPKKIYKRKEPKIICKYTQQNPVKSSPRSWSNFYSRLLHRELESDENGIMTVITDKKRNRGEKIRSHRTLTIITAVFQKKSPGSCGDLARRKPLNCKWKKNSKYYQDLGKKITRTLKNLLKFSFTRMANIINRSLTKFIKHILSCF